MPEHEPPRPIELPFALAQLPGCGGRIGPQPEHFMVDEVALYPCTGRGHHLYLRVRKTEHTTPQVVRMLSKASGVKERDIGYAGLKDKHAVTTQWFSLLGVEAAAVDTWVLPPGVELLERDRHDNKLRTGHLAANHFRIQLVEVERAQPEVVEPLGAALRGGGLLNFFGVQRFGHQGNGLAEAWEWLLGGKRPKSHFLAKLYPSVIQAELFNRYLVRRAERGLDVPLAGEVVRLNGSGKVFVVEDVASETPRLQSGDIHLTGPIWGPKMKPAMLEARELEQQVMDELGLDAAACARLEQHAPGTRRDLLVRVDDLTVEIPEARSLVLSFTLPSGAYATQLVREFTR